MPLFRNFVTPRKASPSGVVVPWFPNGSGICNRFRRAYLLNIREFEELTKDKHTRGRSGVLDQLRSRGALRCLRHEQEWLKFGDEIGTRIHLAGLFLDTKSMEIPCVVEVDDQAVACGGGSVSAYSAWSAVVCTC